MNTVIAAVQLIIANEAQTAVSHPPYLISLAPRDLVDGLAAHWTGRRSTSKSMLTILIRGIVQDVLNHLIIVQKYESNCNKQQCYWRAAVYIV